MNADQDPYRLPQMRASDADRDGMVAALSEHFQTGRLTREDLDERTERALTARTLDELDELTADLPAIRPAGRRRCSGREGWGTRCWHRLLPRLQRWPLPPWYSAWAMAATGGIGGGSSRPVCSSRGGWPGGAVSTGTPGRTDRRARTGHRHRNGVSARTVPCPGTGQGTVSDGLAGTCRSTSWRVGRQRRTGAVIVTPPPPCLPPDAHVAAMRADRRVTT